MPRLFAVSPPLRSVASLPLLFLAASFLGGCAGQGYYTYKYIPGKTAIVRWDGLAVAPPSAPRAVQAMVEAGNRINGLPYRWGGGHGSGANKGYDCSGAASYVLKAGGKLRSPMPSRSFRSYGEPGTGEWVSIYARKDHVFLVIAGLRFDTGWTGAAEGPRWTENSRPLQAAVVRHPAGL